MKRFFCTIRSFLRFCLQIQYPDVSMLLHRVINSFFYPRACYLLVLGDLWEIQAEQGPWPDKKEAEGAPGDLAALLTKAFYSLTFNFVKKTF